MKNGTIKRGIKLYNKHHLLRETDRMTMKKLALTAFRNRGSSQAYKAQLLTQFDKDIRRATITEISELINALHPVPADFILGYISDKQATTLMVENRMK